MDEAKPALHVQADAAEYFILLATLVIYAGLVGFRKN